MPCKLEKLVCWNRNCSIVAAWPDIERTTEVVHGDREMERRQRPRKRLWVCQKALIILYIERYI
jgi:hypothetical protein